ncbi:MAG TPA: right-handed parallel beta-helix repeat-containing protein [Candidatus Brocadiia bacterium]|nr:right-handed parallel beta-helix repeat-containing protein [Candidatus Brocadiia bacterium]
MGCLRDSRSAAALMTLAAWAALGGRFAQAQETPRAGAAPAPSGRAATRVVAPAGAPASLKAQADHVCQGVDDHLVINAAIAALPKEGGCVRLLAGVYSIGGVADTYGGITISRSDVQLAGEGTGTRLVLQDGLTDVNVIWIHGQIENITIRDLFIDGNAKAQTPWVRARSGWNGGNGVKSIHTVNARGGPYPRNVRVENCRITNCQLMAVMLNGEAAEVLNCYFTGGFGSHVIELLGDSGRIEGCTLRLKEGDSAAYGFSTDACYHYHIVNNKIFIDKGGVIKGHPINDWAARHTGDKFPNQYLGVVSGNMVINNGKTGPVLLQGYVVLAHHNLFRGVPVKLAPMTMTFDHNVLTNSGIEIASPYEEPESLISLDGNILLNSEVTHRSGKVHWGANPGHTPKP